MTCPVEVAQNAALGRVGRAESLLWAVPLVDEPNPTVRVAAASRCEGFRDEVMSAADGADPVEACHLSVQGAEALASEMTGAGS